MTAALETRVREAAIVLHDAILEARAAGLRVVWPAAPAALPNIAISATASATSATPPDAGPIAAAVKKAKRNRA